jgi:hypothetical protein
MKDSWKKASYIAVLLAASQFLAFLFDFSKGGALLLGLIASVYYLLEAGEVLPREAASGAAGFTVSGFAFSSAGKILVLDGLCEISGSNMDSSLSGAVSSDQVCIGFLEAWIAALFSNPIYNWYFWVFAVAAGVLSVYMYRRYGEQDVF